MFNPDYVCFYIIAVHKNSTRKCLNHPSVIDLISLVLNAKINPKYISYY